MRFAVVPLLALTVGFVLADSAIVTLALPEILTHLGGTVAQVAWVLIAFNLVLAVTAVPAALICERRDPAMPTAVGIAVFGAASIACALAGSIGFLIAARCVQAAGGALALVGCLELLVSRSGETRGIGRWIGAGVVGTAAGPVVGGLLTAAISWQSIFVVQVPVAVLAVPAALAVRGTAGRPVIHRQRPAIVPNVALTLLSAAFTAALFLLVLLLVDGWNRSPAVAALTVSVVPVAAFAAPLLARLLRAGPVTETVAGCVLVAGGLVGLALPPSASLGWVIAPQVLVGLGLGLTVEQLTAQALRDRNPRVRHGGWTIGARHAGVVLGLALLTPVFTSDLHDAQQPAEQAIVSKVLDAPLPPADKIAVARSLGDRLDAQQGRVPDLHPAFASLRVAPSERPAVDRLEATLSDQLTRAATRAFRNSFLVGAALALSTLLALVPLAFRRRPVAP